MTGVINTITVTNGGSSYTSDPTVGFSGGGGSGATATSVRPTALVVSITVNNQGSGYTEEPAVSFSGGSGSGAEATSVVGNRTVTGVTLTNAGTGYTDSPTVSFSGGGGGSGAAAHVVISLTGITVTNNGSGYVNPTVSITGGGGTGATATATVGVIDTSKQFTGQRLDSTGLYYYNARYYDASIGRFISPDTVGVDYRQPQTLNRYSYCQNNPLKYTDPTGHFNVAEDWGGWDAGEVTVVVVPQVINSGGVGTGFAPIDTSQYAPDMPVVDDAGWGTAGVGFNFQGTVMGFSVSAGASWVWDDTGNSGLMLSGGFGGGPGYTPNAVGVSAGLGWSFTLQGQWTNANSIQDLNGPASVTGGSATLTGNLGVGGEMILSNGGDGWGGFNFQTGFVGGYEFHTLVEWSWVFD